MAPVAGPSVGRPISGHGKKSRRTRLSGNIGAEGSDYEDDATELEYLDHLKDTKKTSTAPTRSRITSNFDPSYHGGTGTDSETSDASQQPPPKKVPSKQRPSSKLSLGAPTASTSKSADSSPKRSTGVQSMLAGLKIHKGPQQPSQSVATAEQSASDGGTPVPPAERKIISARAQRRLNAGKDPIKREWWQTECGVSTTFVAALKKGQFTPTRPGNLKIWGATKPIMHKNVGVLWCLAARVHKS